MKGADSENSPLPFLFLFAPKKKTLPVELLPIPLGVIRQHGEDVALDAGTERAGCEHRRSGRYAAREPVISEECAHLFHGVLAFHGDYAVESGDIHTSAGTKFAPMPWMRCGAAKPLLMSGLSAGSTA